MELKITLAKSSPEEMEKMLAFFSGLESIFDGEFESDDLFGDYEEERREAIGKYVEAQWEAFLSFSWERFYWGFSTLLDNAANPDLDYLAWSPEIMRTIESRDILLSACRAARADYDHINYPTEAHKAVMAQLDAAIAAATAVPGENGRDRRHNVGENESVD